MNINHFILVLLNKNTMIFKDYYKIQYLYVSLNDNIYQIKLDNNIENMCVKLNSYNNKINFTNEEKEEILNVLYFCNKSYLRHLKAFKELFLDISHKYIIKNFQIININNYLNILENETKHRVNKELKLYKKEFILSIFSNKFNLDFSIFEKKKIVENVENNFVDKEFNLKEIVNNILISKQIIIDNEHIVNIYTKEYHIIYDISKEYQILINEELFKINELDKSYIYKSLSKKNNSMMKSIVPYSGLEFKKICNSVDFDESFNYINDYKYKINIIKKKNESKSKSKKAKVIVKKEKKKINIIGTNDKNARIKREDIFNSNGFGTLGELLGKQEVELKNEFDNTNNEKAYFKPKLLNKKEKVISNEIESLVLWDLENIHYFDDFSTISRYVKSDNQFKIMAFSEKYRNYETINTLNFILNKLKKRNWIIKETKKIADDTLIEQFHKYKHSIKELIVISNDSDFRYIVQEANDLNIKTIVLHRHGRTKNSFWYDIASENISLKDIQ